MQKYEQVTKGRKDMIFNNFIGGIAWGVGVTIGAALLVTLIALLAQPLSLVPIFGDFLADVLDYALKALQPQI